MDLSSFFAGLDSTSSTLFLVANIISFLFGFILAWILWGGQVRRLKRELESANANTAAAQAELVALQEAHKKAKADVAELSESLEMVQANMQNLQLDYDRLRTKSQGLEEKNVELAELIETYESNIEALNDQVLGLRTRNQALAAEVETGTGNAETTVDGLAQMQSSYNAALQRMTTVEEKLARLEDQNRQMHLELETMKAGGVPLELDALSSSEAEPAATDTQEALNARKDAAREAVAAAIGNQIPRVKPKKKDDLKLINGIGPFIEGQLNEIEIYAFQQIAAFDDKTIDDVTTAIGFFPGRILRDDWIGQAARLAAIKEDHPEALETQAVFPNNPEDLKLVEGIGPKIEEVLKNAGIQTWKDLAGSDPDQLRTILQEAGGRFRMHNPATWPKQAKMAVKGKWEKLKEYQDYLKGGRED